MLESYRYDPWGNPSYFNASNTSTAASGYGIVDLYAGERWISDLGLYDLRNRFMSSELGRFLQADPIGFKGDASNLYRYCGNDSVNKSDPMGLENPPARIPIDRMWESAKYWDTANSFQGSFNEWMDRFRPQAGMGDNAGGGGAKSVSSENEGGKSMGFIGLANRIHAARTASEAAEELYAQEGTAIDRAKDLAKEVGAGDYGRGEKRKPGDLRITNYGFKGDNVRGDQYTPQRIGIQNRVLTPNSVALSRDLAKQYHPGNGMYINGRYIGNFVDTTSDKSFRTIDVYDPRGRGEWRVFFPAGSYKLTEGPALMNY